MPHHGAKSQAFFERAQNVIPYGVNSNFRYDGDNTPLVADARDGYVYDFDGKKYIDYRLGYGPVILGHADPYVTEVVSATLGGNTEVVFDMYGHPDSGGTITLRSGSVTQVVDLDQDSAEADLE